MTSDQDQKDLKIRQRALAAQKVADPIILIDAKRRVMFANKAAKNLLGKKQKGKDLALILPDPSALEAVSLSLDDGKTRVFETTFAGPVTRFYEITVVPISPKAQRKKDISTGDDPLAVISFHDITGRKRAEKMRTDFVANAGHELKTPLTSLLGFIETLQGPAITDQKALEKFLPIMHAEADRMVKVIDDLMSLSKIEAQEHLHPETKVAIAAITRNVASAMQMAAESRSIDLVFNIPDDIPAVLGENEQLFQALRNLVSNAIKYGRENTRVTVSARPVNSIGSLDTPGVEISVTDQGEGIPAEHLPRMTERFYRVDTARSRKIGGTGLGLAIVKHIVTRHRGTLKIESEVGKGTTVIVTLPQD